VGTILVPKNLNVSFVDALIIHLLLDLVSLRPFQHLQSATIAGTQIALYADANCMITLVQYICE